jgi:NodT family efflux transporter outer membrane factor (OMF) lipoprotein
MHTQAKPLTTTTLKKHQVFSPPKQVTISRGWWTRFHDPQLNQLVETALHDSPDMETAKARISKAKYLADATESTLWPSIEFSGYEQRQRFSQYGLVPPPFNGETLNIAQLGFNLNYDFDVWGKNRQLLAARVNEWCASQADYAEARLILSAAVASAYFQLLNNIEQVSIAKQHWQTTKEVSSIVVVRAKKGIESDIPVQTAIKNTQASKLIYEQWQQSEMLSRNELAALLGQNPLATQIRTHRFVYHQFAVNVPNNLTANVLAYRPDIYAAKTRVEASTHHINAAKARFFPNISLNAFFTYESIIFGKLFNSGSQNNAISGAIDLPIFDGGLRRANLGERDADYDAAVANYNRTLLTALRETADGLTKLNSINSQLKTEQMALTAVKQQYKLGYSRYNHGVIDYVQVLETKQSLLNRQAQEVNLKAHRLLAMVELFKALGGSDYSQQG